MQRGMQLGEHPTPSPGWHLTALTTYCTDISISFKFVVMNRFEGLLLFTEDSSSITQRECNLISWFQWPEFGWIHESFLAKVHVGFGGCLCG